MSDVIDALAAIVRHHAGDPETGGRLALEALRAAGATWRDVLPWWPTGGGCSCPRLVADRVRILAQRLDLVPPFELAQVAVLLATPLPELDPRAVASWSALDRLPDAADKAALAGIIDRHFDRLSADRAGRMGEFA